MVHREREREISRESENKIYDVLWRRNLEFQRNIEPEISGFKPHSKKSMDRKESET